jgi:CBS domain-containing protein
MMNTEKIRAMPVVQDEKVVGIITWRGLLRADMPVIDGVRWTKEILLKEKRIGDIMTVNPIGVLPNSLCRNLPASCSKTKFPALPVFNEKRGPWEF